MHRWGPPAGGFTGEVAFEAELSEECECAGKGREDTRCAGVRQRAGVE